MTFSASSLGSIWSGVGAVPLIGELVTTSPSLARKSSGEALTTRVAGDAVQLGNVEDPGERRRVAVGEQSREGPRVGVLIRKRGGEHPAQV
jgi:hypothetical protein